MSQAPHRADSRPQAAAPPRSGGAGAGAGRVEQTGRGQARAKGSATRAAEAGGREERVVTQETTTRILETEAELMEFVKEPVSRGDKGTIIVVSGEGLDSYSREDLEEAVSAGNGKGEAIDVEAIEADARASGPGSKRVLLDWAMRMRRNKYKKILVAYGDVNHEVKAPEWAHSIMIQSLGERGKLIVGKGVTLAEVKEKNLGQMDLERAEDLHALGLGDLGDQHEIKVPATVEILHMGDIKSVPNLFEASRIRTLKMGRLLSDKPFYHNGTIDPFEFHGKISQVYLHRARDEFRAKHQVPEALKSGSMIFARNDPKMSPPRRASRTPSPLLMLAVEANTRGMSPRGEGQVRSIFKIRDENTEQIFHAYFRGIERNKAAEHPPLQIKIELRYYRSLRYADKQMIHDRIRDFRLHEDRVLVELED